MDGPGPFLPGLIALFVFVLRKFFQVNKMDGPGQFLPGLIALFVFGCFRNFLSKITGAIH